MAGSNGWANGRRRASLAAAVLALALLSVPTGLGAAPSYGGGGAALRLVAEASFSGPNLTVLGSAAWTVAGNATAFSAAWTGAPPVCTVTPLWYRWSLGTGSVEGFLAGTSGSSTNLTGATTYGGTLGVTVRAAASETCGNATRSFLGAANGSVLEVAPLALGAVTAGPATLGVGGTATLVGRFSGGAAPYEAAVAWGDGSSGAYELPSAGSFNLSHAYATAGADAPSISIADSAGQEVNGAVPEPLQVRDGTALVVEASLPVAEVGTPLRLVGFASDPPSTSASIVLSACNQTATSDGGEPAISCDPTTPGTLTVLLEPGITFVPRPPVAELLEPVVAPLSVAARSTGPVGPETPPAIEVELEGGVAPFQLNWSLGGTPEPGIAAIPSDGTVALEALAGTGGLAGVLVRVVDADGVVRTVLNASAYVAPPLTVTFGATSTVEPPVAGIVVTATLAGGVPPYAWVVEASAPFGGPGPTGGVSSVSGSLRWSDTVSAEGWGSVSLEVVDGVGEVVATSLPTEFLPALAASFRATIASGPGGSVLEVNLSVAGGAPPFEVWLNGSGVTLWNGSEPGAAPLGMSLPLPAWSPASAPLSLSVSIVDRYAYRVQEGTVVVATVEAAPPPPSAAAPDGSGSTLELGGLAGALLLGAAGFFAWRTRRSHRSSTPAPTPDPEQVLERILRPADGAERVTVELLAEEAGVPLDTVRATLDRLVARGRVHAEVTPEGEEVLAWSTERSA